MIERFVLSFLLLWGFANSALGQAAQQVPVDVEYIKRQNVEQRLQPFGDNILGDTIDLKTGSLSFNHVDVSLPGNFDLEVAIRRTRTSDYAFESSNLSHFGDWALEVPHITTIVEGGDGPGNGAPSTNAACGINVWPPVGVFPDLTDPYIPSDPNSAYIVEGYEYSNGLNLIIPGQGSKQLLTNPKGISWPSGATYVTRDNWFVKCISGGDGYEATAPNGDVYRFDNFKHKNARPMSVGNAALRRFHAVYQATSVTDVHGNTVNYGYDSDGLLQQISASDGRLVSLAYNYDPARLYFSRKQISSITANNRVWNYTYSGTHTLGQVTRPDNQSWSFSIGGALSPISDPRDCPSFYTNVLSASVTHPNGITGTFELKPYKHIKYGSLTMMARCTNQTMHPVDFFLNRSVVSKTLSGSGYPAKTWSFDYSNATGTGIWGESVNPEGHRTRKTYNGQYGALADLEIKSEVFASTTASSPLKAIESFYLAEAVVGDSYLENTNRDKLTRPNHMVKRITTQDGDSFTSEMDYVTDHSASNYSYGSPTQTRVFSNVSTSPRVTDTTYEHNTSEWILGLPKTVTQNGRLLSTNSYDPNTGQLTSIRKYGAGYDYVTLAYNSADGTIDMVTDAEGRVTKASNWKGGTAQDIQSAFGSVDEITTHQYVDDNGWLTSQVDAKGQTTSYDHDAMGRLTQINPAGSYYANTDISYTFPSSGGAVQTITKGQSETTITYDSLFRPILEKTAATDTGWASYVTTQYDALGRVTFQSQPSSSSFHAQGMSYTYDGLGRVLTTAETASGAQTQHSYHGGHRHTVRDPEQNVVHYYSYGYDGPGNTDYRKIYEASGGRLTQPIKNIWGEMVELRQKADGANAVDNKTLSHFFYYDNERRMCRYYTPEGGATLYDYDAAGQMVAYAKGQPDTGCTVPTNADRVDLTYDSLGRLKDTDFYDPNTPDVFRTYDDNGNLLFVNRGSLIDTVDWAYTYDELNNLLTENLQLDGRSYSLAYQYNASGHMTRKTLPTGRTVDYTPDGLGRSTAITTQGTPLVSTASYHANGAVSTMSYGNGHDFTQTLNARLLPHNLNTSKGSDVAVDLTYTYDLRGKVTSLANAAPTGDDRSFTYNALGQLTSESGYWSAPDQLKTTSYDYDSLGNMVSKQGGSLINFIHDANNRLTHREKTGEARRVYEYDHKGNVTLRRREDCVIDHSFNYVGGGGTTWDHIVTYDACANRVNGVSTQVSNSGQTPPSQQVNIEGFGEGESNSTLFTTYVISNGLNYQVELEATLTGNDIAFRHRTLREDRTEWGTWKDHGVVTTLPIQGESLAFTYDASDQPVRIVGTATGDYHYDGNLKRVKSVIDGSIIYNVYDASGSLVHVHKNAEDPVTETETDYVSGPHGALARISNGEIRYLHNDHLGSAYAGTNATGGVEWRDKYFAWGNSKYKPIENQDQGGFTGHIKDSATDLIYMQARYYDYESNRFLSIDPVTFLDNGNPAQFNRYSYTWNDPINGFDPDGRETRLMVEAHHLDMDVVNGNMTRQQRQSINVSQAKGAAAGLGGIGTGLAVRAVASRFLFQGIAVGEAGLGMAASEFSGTTNVIGAVRNVTAEGLTALNKQFSNGLTMVGKDASTVVANASYRSDAHDQAASVIRDVAGGHLFQNGNKRTAQAAVEGMEISGLSSSQIRSTIDNVATGDIKNIDEIADSLRGN